MVNGCIRFTFHRGRCFVVRPDLVINGIASKLTTWIWSLGRSDILTHLILSLWGSVLYWKYQKYYQNISYLKGWARLECNLHYSVIVGSGWSTVFSERATLHHICICLSVTLWTNSWQLLIYQWMKPVSDKVCPKPLLLGWHRNIFFMSKHKLSLF